MNQVNVKDLQQLKNLASFAPTQLEKLAANLLIKTFEKNEIVFDQDEEVRFIYLLLSGIVRVSYINSHERQTIVSLLPAGELFGIDSLIPQAHHAFRCAKHLMTARLVPLNRRLLLKYFWALPTIIFSAGTPLPFIPEGMLTSTALKASGWICAGALRWSC